MIITKNGNLSMASLSRFCLSHFYECTESDTAKPSVLCKWLLYVSLTRRPLPCQYSVLLFMLGCLWSNRFIVSLDELFVSFIIYCLLKMLELGPYKNADGLEPAKGMLDIAEKKGLYQSYLNKFLYLDCGLEHGMLL